MGTSCLNRRPSIWMLTTLPKCKAWTKKYNGHAWCKLVTTNMNNLFRFSFRKVHCLGHLWSLQDDCENFVRSNIHNETFWCSECIHIPVLGQTTMIPSSSSLGCKFCHSLPFFVVNYGGRIYYVAHRFQSISKMAIHLGVHNHHVVNGKCRELIEDWLEGWLQKRLIARLMQKSFQFPLVVIRPSWWVTCLMILETK